MNKSNLLTQFSNKQATLRFSRQELHLSLSQSLFSSFDIDVGTRLLLKTIAKEMPLDDVQTVLDMGCGVGALGLALAKAAPHISLTAQDRDALAVAFTQLNARQNKIEALNALGGLAFQGVEGSFDLIVANLPGKAGEPVLRYWLGEMAARLADGGKTAVVIVNPLAPFIAETLQQQGSEIVFREAGKGHTVFHFRGGQPTIETADPLQPYTRGQFPFKLGQQTLTLRTVYNLPEFDTLGHHTALAIGTGKNETVSGHVLVWNPGQGHMPLYLHRQFGPHLSHITLAGRDALSLQISAANLLAYGADPQHITRQHVPHLLALHGRFDWIVIFPEADPGVPWENYLLPAIYERLNKNGRCLLTAKSAFVFRLLAAPHALRKVRDRKKRGFRALLLARE